jgi:hypothetical protein
LDEQSGSELIKFNAKMDRDRRVATLGIVRCQREVLQRGLWSGIGRDRQRREQGLPRRSCRQPASYQLRNDMSATVRAVGVVDTSETVLTTPFGE